ncbi:MAG: N-acetyltransferase [Selenomonadaceae bacterium]|nr:N-acetyltransferase [Selenomonadaceae bacterium]
MTELKIRNATLDDAPRLVEIYSYYVEKTAISFEYEVPSVEKFQARMARTQKKYPYLVAELNGEIVGYAYAKSFIEREAYKFSAELTIYLDKNFRKQGVGGKLYSQLEKNLREIGITNLYTCVGYPEVEDEFLTLNSVHFHEHCGYRICGKFTNCGYKFNRRYSMVWMEKIVGGKNESD